MPFCCFWGAQKKKSERRRKEKERVKQETANIPVSKEHIVLFQEVKKKLSSHLEYKTIKCLFENVSNSGAVPSAVERLAASAPKQKLTDIKGCDWLAELSVTVRKFKRTPVLRERQQRNAMLETLTFHQRLLCGVTSPPIDLPGMNAEHFQNMALDILLWIGAVQVNDPNKRSVAGEYFWIISFSLVVFFVLIKIL